MAVRGRSVKGDRWLVAIGASKIFYGALLVAAGFGALSLLHENVAQHVKSWIEALWVDPDNHYIHALLTKLRLVNDSQLKRACAGSFIYASLLFTQGAGLSLRKRWALYMTVITTGLLIPLEIYGFYRSFSPLKLLVIAVNCAAVSYLIYRLRSGRAK